ncbi:MAG TPA: hypothetical protein VFP87_05760, partial [Chitinophagaceae bacterium]|nr:hypothetical protein [Chitinophagaceae bacterium]
MIKALSYHSNARFIILCGVFVACTALAAITTLYWLALFPFGLLLAYFGWQQPQFIFFLLIFSLPWSFEYNINSSLGTDLPDEPFMWLATALFIAYAFFYPEKILSGWRHPLVFLLLLHLGWIVVTVFLSTDWVLSSKFFMAKGWYVIAFVLWPLLLFKNKKVIQFTALLVLLSMVLVTIICLYRHSLTGFRFATINDAVHPFFRNHVNYSAMLVCTVPLLVAVYQLNRTYRLWIFVAMGIVLAALFFSYARGAWLALIVGLVAYWLVSSRRLLFAFI